MEGRDEELNRLKVENEQLRAKVARRTVASNRRVRTALLVVALLAFFVWGRSL
jgi:hypothetical protein